MNLKIKNLKNNHSGVVLIMSLMILAVMIISVVALSRVIVGEVKMTRNSDNSIVAFYAAETGVEKALYYLKLGRQNANFADFLELEGDEIFMDNERNYSFAQSTTTSDYFEAFDITTSSPATAQLILPDGSIPIWSDSLLSSNYTINWEINNCSPTHSSDRLEVSATSLYKDFDNSPFKSDTQQFIYTCGCNSDDNCNEIFSNSIDANKLYYFTFRPLDSDITYLKLTPENKYPGQANIEVVGNYRQSSHTINVKVNTMAPASNIFSYVLFSDDELS